MKVISFNNMHHVLKYGNLEQEYINYSYLDALKLFIKELKNMSKQNLLW